MHPSVMEWVGKKVQAARSAKPALRVLEVGSRDINGTVRLLFLRAWRHIRASISSKGPASMSSSTRTNSPSTFAPNSFDVVVSTEMLEHDSEFWTSMAMMGEVLKPGGLLLISRARQWLLIHGYPCRLLLLPSGIVQLSLLRYAGCDVLEVTEDRTHRRLRPRSQTSMRKLLACAGQHLPSRARTTPYSGLLGISPDIPQFDAASVKINHRPTAHYLFRFHARHSHQGEHQTHAPQLRSVTRLRDTCCPNWVGRRSRIFLGYNVTVTFPAGTATERLQADVPGPAGRALRPQSTLGNARRSCLRSARFRNKAPN